MNVLYFDCVGGAAGDMLLASLIDLGVPADVVRQAIERLQLPDVRLEVVDARPAGLRALQVDMIVRGELADTSPEWTPLTQPRTEPGPEHQHGHRPYSEVRDRVSRAGLDPRAEAIALDAFHRLAHAEAQAHGIDVEDVEFHEVGADDALADVVGVATALAHLGPDRVRCSPLPLGRGLVRGAHGPIPLPGPATLALLAGAPTVETDLRGETVTPTGASLLRASIDDFGPIPSMVLQRTGVGAGHKTWPDRPNVVRALWGTAEAAAGSRTDECVVEANVDDLWPAHLPGLLVALMEAGAVDAWAETVLMKKGRSGLKISALVARSGGEAVTQAFFRHGSTLGVRRYDVERTLLPRRLEAVDTPFGTVRVKVSARPGGGTLVVPEFDDCESVAEAAGRTVREVFDAAVAAGFAGFGDAG